MIDFKNIWIDFNCPNCSYSITVRLIDVKTESQVPCYCCKTWIKLVDKEASTHVTIDHVETEIKKLEQTLKSFGK